MTTSSMSGMATMKYHFRPGKFPSPGWKVATFMPKKPEMKVKGRKMKVIQERRHMERPSWRDWRESRISTDLYI